MREGTKADLARELGISRASVSQSFKRHNIQLPDKFDLDYAAWLLREKQNFMKTKAQRAAKKQVSGLKNPRLKREVIRLLWPVWDEAISRIIHDRAADGLDAETWDDLEKYLETSLLLWDAFHRMCEREYPADIGDFPYRLPDCIDFDFMEVQPREQIEKILQSVSSPLLTANGQIDYDALPLEELERLVLADDFCLFDLENTPPPEDAPLDDPETMPESPLLPPDSLETEPEPHPLPPGQETEPEPPPLPYGVSDTGAEK